MEPKLIKLAELVNHRNEIGGKISALIGRPAIVGHIGEFIAGIIFDIRLEQSASRKAIDGYFRTGSPAGKSVNVKWYGKQESILDITPDSLPDYYLVMTGPGSFATSSRGDIRPWLIEYVYLFDSASLVSDLSRRNLKIGIATSVRKSYWENAEIYPRQKNQNYIITKEQKEMLQLFGGV
jgi:hypothetical protein